MKVWVLLNKNDVVVGASVDDGKRESRAFLEPVPADCRLCRVDTGGIGVTLSRGLPAGCFIEEFSA
jgi:hypothetical protein